MQHNRSSSLSKNLIFQNENRLPTFDFCTGDSIKFTKALDPNKAHGYNGKSICMIKLCASSMSKLCIFFFKTVWKMYVSTMNGRRQILFLPTKKEISNILIIIDQYRYCQLALNFLRKLFSTPIPNS